MTLQLRAPLNTPAAEATVSDCGCEASAVFFFSRGAQQIVKMHSPAPGGRTPRGAGNMAGRGPNPSPPSVWYYRQYRQQCGMLVPTELEACWQLPGGEHSYAHMDVQQLAAWESLEMVPPQSQSQSLLQ